MTGVSHSTIKHIHQELASKDKLPTSVAETTLPITDAVEASETFNLPNLELFNLENIQYTIFEFYESKEMPRLTSLLKSVKHMFLMVKIFVC